MPQNCLEQSHQKSDQKLHAETESLEEDLRKKCVICGTEIRIVKRQLVKFKLRKTCSRECRIKWCSKRQEETSEMIEARFLSKIVKTKTCWLWNGWKTQNSGYGMFQYKSKDIGAHRFSWMMHNSYAEIPNKMCVMHSCDNRICVNPEHIRLATYSENNKDTVLKGHWKKKGLGINFNGRMRDASRQNGCRIHS